MFEVDRVLINEKSSPFVYTADTVKRFTLAPPFSIAYLTQSIPFQFAIHGALTDTERICSLPPVTIMQF